MANKKTNVEPVAPPTATPVAPPATPAPPGGPAPTTPVAAASAFSLDASLRWKAATPDEQKVLENLQGNILKGHGRDQTMNIFFKLGSDVRLSKQALRELGNFFVTSAYKQLLDTEAFKAAKGKCDRACSDDGTTFCALFLSASGYKSLQLTFTPPADNAACPA
jgi:hypothetical protein